MLIRIFQAFDTLMFYVLVPAASLFLIYMGASGLINMPVEQYGFIMFWETPDMRKMMLLSGVLLLLGWCLMGRLRKRRQAMMKELDMLRKK